ncbi:MAG: carboxypeptidase regulatory-like domain-containing protein [Planctomycetota bacterium]|nr:MAG: carboxypeptidase regulatory-like domain-containing protein [Planctomycetota bacterium]
MSKFRAVLTVLMLAMALAFALSVIFPPRHEWEMPGGVDLLVQDLRDGVPAEVEGLPGGNAQKQEGLRESLRPPMSYDLQIEVREEGTGQPIAEATVRLESPLAGGQIAEILRWTDYTGKVYVAKLAAQTYTVVVDKVGYFSSAPLALAVPDEQTSHQIELRPGAMLSGQVLDTQGRSPNFGLIRLRKRGPEQEERIFRLQLDGSFQTDTLSGGLWVLDWLPHYNAKADPRITTEIALVPQDHRRLEIVVERGTEEEAPGDRFPGVRWLN